MNLRTTIALVVFGVAAVISFLLNRGGDEDDTRDQSDLQAGYYLKGVSLTGTDAMGAIKYTLHAERVDHDPVDGSIALDNLALDYGNDESPWTMRASRGWMPSSSGEISLSGDVQVEKDRSKESGRTTINSETLHVDIDNQSASTADAVQITMGRGSLQGVGLEVDFANEQVSILSDVQGVFDPPPE